MAFPGSVCLRGGDIYRTSTVQIYPLGTRGYTNDGRVYRYTKNGTSALTVGKLIQNAVINADWSDDAVSVTGAAVTSGTTKIKVHFSTDSSNGPSSVNSFAEGYLFVNDGNGEGQMVQVLSHEAWTTAAAGGKSTIQFMDYAEFTTGISTVTTASELGIIKNLYDDVVVFPATMTGVPVGVTPRAVAANAYFWLQTWGLAVCVVNSAGVCVPKVGYPLMPATEIGQVHRPFLSFSTKKASEAASISNMRAAWIAQARPLIGTCVEVGADGETGLVDLKLAP